MNNTHATQQPQIPTPPKRTGDLQRCARPHCHNLVQDAWEDTGTLCAKCAIESDLFDRAARWERAFPHVH